LKDAISAIQEEAKRTQVMVFAGGLGRRMGSSSPPKALLPLAGEVLIDRCISLFVKAGFRDFVFLLGHAHEEVASHVGDGTRYGIRASFSVDPKENYGRGKSLIHALEGRKADRTRRGVVTFPDDVFLDESMPFRVLSEHLYGVKTYGIAASLVLTSGRNWPYGVADVDERNLITRFTEKPFISRPTSVGNYIFEPAVYAMLRSAPEIERELIPKLASAGKLYAIFIPPESWLPINTAKDFEEAESVLSRREP